MNEKANVTKDLNAKHANILEGLLRLPENRECADCSNKAPRWASVNIGAFICMQCSGIHRSLGVHISKVRSTTLDTWLPEQVAFMQRVGNKKSNSYWEANLPADFDRKPIENFIRAKYVEKTWVNKKAMQSCPEHYDTPNRLSDAGSTYRATRKERRLSLEEEILAQHVAQMGPPQHRGWSLDMKDVRGAPSSNGGRPPLGDALLYSLNPKQELSTTTPSNWQTFESSVCIYIYIYINLFLPHDNFISISLSSSPFPLPRGSVISSSPETPSRQRHRRQSTLVRFEGEEEQKLEGEKATVKSSTQSSLPLQSPTTAIGTTAAAAAAMPTWLRSSIDYLTERMQILEINNILEEHDSDDTFSQRAETYYRKQPKLLSLLKDLYNSYISLSDRYIHVLSGTHKRRSSQGSIDGDTHSDVESSLSYQRLSTTPNYFHGDDLLVEFVVKSAERDLMVHELGVMERWCGESSVKIGLQRNLLEVMEAERSFLLSQNKSLVYKLAILEEENREISYESSHVRSRANELARCVLEMKEEESVGRLLNTIEGLQDRVHGLEEKNMEYCKVIANVGENGGGGEGALRGCFGMEKLKKWKVKVKVKVGRKGKKGRKWKISDSEGQDLGGRWWRKVKNLGIFKRVGRRPSCG